MDKNVLYIPNEKALQEIQRALGDLMDKLKGVFTQEGETLLGVAAIQQRTTCSTIVTDLTRLSGTHELRLEISSGEELELLIHALQERRMGLMHRVRTMIGQCAHAARASAHLIEQLLGLLKVPLSCSFVDHLKEEEPVPLTKEARSLLDVGDGWV